MSGCLMCERSNSRLTNQNQGLSQTWEVFFYWFLWLSNIHRWSGRKRSVFLIELLCLIWMFWHFDLVLSGFLVFLAMAVYTGVTINYYGKRYGNWRFSWSYIIGWVSVVLTFFSGKHAKPVTRKLPKSLCCHFNQTEKRRKDCGRELQPGWDSCCSS